MKLFNLVSAVLAFRLTDAYLVAPPGTPAPGADLGCSEWVQQSYGLTCAIIEQFFGMTAAQFEAWNPSVTLLGPGCNLIKGLYYCVQVDYVSMSFLSTGPPTAATTTSTASSTTSGGNGITTPTPTQSGMVGNCNKFYMVVSGDECGNIAATYSISLANFYAWNPAVGSSCATLWPGYHVCVGIAGSGPSSISSVPSTTKASSTTRVLTTTTSGNGITTPTPTQSGMVGNCNKFYMVVSGDECGNIAATYSISLANFYAWNPAVGSSCATLWPDYYVCVGITGGSITTTVKTSTPTKATPSTTTKGNGVATPTPTQANMTTNCKTFYDVKSGDDCFDIAAAANITLSNFYAWNPAVGSSCSALWPNYYVCIGIV